MRYYNILDQLGRFTELKVEFEEEGQVDSHGISYLGARQLQIDAGFMMGFDCIECEFDYYQLKIGLQEDVLDRKRSQLEIILNPQLKFNFDKWE